MTARKATDKQILHALKRNNWQRRATAADLGINRSNLATHISRMLRNGVNIPLSPEQIETSAPALQSSDLNRKELKELRATVTRLSEERLTDSLVRKEILRLSETNLKIPDWVLSTPKTVTNNISGVPTLFASDWHWGEVVRASEIGGVNKYNLAIAKTRAKTMVDIAVRLLKHYIKNPSYPGIVFALGGDMVSGDIHEELAQTNELESIPTVLDILGTLIWCIDTLAKEFGRVFVPCVAGNHGRTSRKPRAKRRNHTNYDWLIYQLLKRHFERDDRISFLIPEGSDAYYRVYDHRYLLTHGDQFRGGDGMIGMLGPVLRGDHRKRTRQSQVNQSYDTMIMGHWHQLTQLTRVIVNGSLKGYDEYAAQGNFTFEQPAQALWITHPKHGITFSMPVYVDPSKSSKKSESESEWVSIQKE